jgi:glycosyltransferase involved in cell wall biosynthesis
MRYCQVNRERGIPVYAQSLVLALPGTMPGTTFHLWHDPRLPPPTMAGALASQVGPFQSTRDLMNLPPSVRITDLLSACIVQDGRGPLLPHLFPPWLQAHQPRRLGIVYDLIPGLFRDRYLRDPLDLNRYLEGLRCLRQWDQLFAISASTREDAIRHAGVAPARIHTIYGGLDPAKAEAIRSGGLPWRGRPLPEPYAVYVGGDDWRKNLEGAIRGFAAYQRAGGRIQGLVLVCGLAERRRQAWLQLAREEGLPEGSVILTGQVSDAELAALVKGAAVSLYPSLYEGLGLPVLESYACGVPVLASDRSSLPELVPAPCRFDPERPSGLADAMLVFDRDPAIRRASLARGQEVLRDFTWPGTAGRLAKALAAHGSLPALPHPAVAMVGVLPPERTGIAQVNARHLRLTSTPVHFFSAFARVADRLAHAPHPWARLAHPRCLRVLQSREGYAQRLFVLGNSGHHQATLDALRSLRYAPGQTWLYLHDGDLLGFWLADLGGDLRAVARLYAQSYPEWHGAPADLLSPARPRGLRPLLDLGRDIGVIVNSQWTRDRVLADLGAPPALGVHALFLPVEPHRPQPPRPPDGTLRVGTFGKPEKTKQLDRLAAAARILAQGRSTRLLVAGFDAGAFVAREGLGTSRELEVLDNPAEEALLAAMRSVDVAVQLRFPSHGEASGVVGHLLGMGIPLVVTDAGGFSELAPAALLVPPDATPDRLAQAILKAQHSPALRQAAWTYRAAHLPEAFVSALDGLLAAHR